MMYEFYISSVSEIHNSGSTFVQFCKLGLKTRRYIVGDLGLKSTQQEQIFLIQLLLILISLSLQHKFLKI
jgi:hypothetical protein